MMDKVVMPPKKTIALGAVVALICLGLFLFLRGEPHIVVSGYVENREVGVGFLLPGRVSEICVEEGQQVKKGDILAYLENSTERYNLQKAKLDVLDKQSNKRFLDRELERQRALSSDRINSQRDYDMAQSQAIRAEAAYDMAQTGLEQAQYQWNQTVLSAPSAGVITRRLIEKGSIVSMQPVITIAIEDQIWVRAYASAQQLQGFSSGSPVKVQLQNEPELLGTIGYISTQAEFTPKTVHTPDLRPFLVYRFRVLLDNTQQANSVLRQGIPVSVILDKTDR